MLCIFFLGVAFPEYRLKNWLGNYITHMRKFVGSARPCKLTLFKQQAVRKKNSSLDKSLKFAPTKGGCTLHKHVPESSSERFCCLKIRKKVSDGARRCEGGESLLSCRKSWCWPFLFKADDAALWPPQTPKIVFSPTFIWHQTIRLVSKFSLGAPLTTLHCFEVGDGSFFYY